VNGAEDAKEDFLGEIQSLVAVAEEVHGQLNHHALVFSDQIGAGRLIAPCAALHKRCLTAADFRPTDDPGLLH
jgi:hypothetical protein